ncbi:MAG TPA: murein L,D-transpeptidase catalytic domain family protein [Gemmatimonadales bacterium]|nr:murein L,D-transpeptidase catalytic domain family protein [Gemmatimonadales bacterium]
MAGKVFGAVAAALLCVGIPTSRTAAGIEPGTVAVSASADSGASTLSDELVHAASAAGLSTNVLALAVEAHDRVVAEGRSASPLLTVIDYSKLSREKRLWVLDLDRDSVLAHTLVAHGRNSGGDRATQFSNDPGSNQTSLGTFVTGRTYVGAHGLSLRLIGLDAGVNDNALARAIVIHGADYVNPDVVKTLGRLGRSLGCPALSPDEAPEIINLIKDGTVVFAFGSREDGKSGRREG